MSEVLSCHNGHHSSLTVDINFNYHLGKAKNQGFCVASQQALTNPFKKTVEIISSHKIIQKLPDLILLNKNELGITQKQAQKLALWIKDFILNHSWEDGKDDLSSYIDSFISYIEATEGEGDNLQKTFNSSHTIRNPLSDISGVGYYYYDNLKEQQKVNQQIQKRDAAYTEFKRRFKALCNKLKDPDRPIKEERWLISVLFSSLTNTSFSEIFSNLKAKMTAKNAFYVLIFIAIAVLIIAAIL